MRVSTKGRYGLRIMLELAINYGQDLLTARELAEKQDISDKYVEQIVGILNKSGLLISQRGAAGGYRLSMAPEEITVGDIIRATEGGIHIVDCISENSPHCERENNCITIHVWQEVKDAVDNVVDNITLADLVKQYNENSVFVYQI